MAKTPVENRELWEETLALIDDRKKWGRMFWKHVPGHSGVVGNERCDEIATTYAKGDTPELFEGDLGDYAIDILNITIDKEKSAQRSVTRAHGRTKAYSYLSLVGGVAKRHATWPLCEARVKGKPGVKYKKSVSQEDEAAILRSWGVSL
jgi:ribonuclease HI